MVDGETNAGGASRGASRGTLRGIASTLIEILRTRLALLAAEVQDEAHRIGKLWLFAVLSACFFALAVLFITLFLVVWFWDSNRLIAIGGCAAFYLIAAAVLARIAFRRAVEHTRLFRASLGELDKDRELLS
jgi:uncharacterized membrane protein YqjE